MFLRKGVIELLKVVSKDIHPYRLKIWDGFRPRVLQRILHDKITNQFRIKNPDWDEDKLYIESGKYITPANEEGRIPPHLTGGSVDLTMIDQNGEELDMGTIFDHFGIEASYNFKDLPENVLENRKFLRDLMTKVGFRADNEEWWHFDYGNQLWAFDLNKEFAFYGVGGLK
jgi:D-alanyl-D-alanine dipeptidase